MGISTFEIIITLLKEFYYEKNGLDSTIDFLEDMIYELKKIRESEQNGNDTSGY